MSDHMQELFIPRWTMTSYTSRTYQPGLPSTGLPCHYFISIAICRFRGVSKKKGKWEAKVMVNRKWAYRELFDSEEEAARAYDGAVWRLKPKEAKSYVNFKERPGQASNKLAKAARIIERAQAK